MKYIPGFQFVVGTVTKKSMSLMERRQQQKRAVVDKDFIPGEAYKIYNVTRTDDKFLYSFISGSGEKLNLEFNSIAEADQRISRLIGA